METPYRHLRTRQIFCSTCSMTAKGRFYSGTSNLVVPVKQSEYPPPYKGASRLTYYASLFSSVEINATFYKLPQGATVGKWGNSVPGDFRFTFKVPKTVTHAKDFQFNIEELELFIETVDRVEEKKGCLLVQLPPKVSREKEEELSAVLEYLSDSAKGWKTAVEFRHLSWYDTAIYRLLQHYKAGMVFHDMPKSAPPKRLASETFVYLRFHGPDGTYRGSYGNDVLEVHAKQIVKWMKDGKEVYAYFNNTIGAAFSNLQTLNKMVSEMTG